MYIRQYSQLMDIARRIHYEFIEKYAKIKELTSEEQAFSDLSAKATQTQSHDR